MSGLAPLAAGEVLAAVMRQPFMLLFGLFGLVTALGAYPGPRQDHYSCCSITDSGGMKSNPSG
jgi:hypothetical protein